MTRPYAEVIGDPIAHSKSPLIHNFWLGKLGIEAEYRACHVRPDELADYLAGRREDATWRGCNVTIPHKENIASLLDGQDAKARTVGAVNTVVHWAGGRLEGTNTDVDGVAAAVDSRDLTGRTVVIIGAGGAARSAFAFLAGKDCDVRVLARTPEKALHAASERGFKVEAVPFNSVGGSFAGAALVINATQLGMKGQEPMPDFVLAELAGAATDALVFDMVYAPLETALLAAARARGLRTADGLVMLVGQAATAFERFFGRPPPREHDAELRTLLTA